MNKLWIALCVVLFLACKEISFKAPQPKGKRALSEIPASLRGKYLLVEADTDNHDTLTVTSKGYSVTNDSTRGELSDNFVLKKYKGYYFFNHNDNPEWLLRVVKKEPNGDLSYFFMDSGEKSFDAFLYELNNQIKVDSFEVNNEKLYQIDPTPKELIFLIKTGYFKKSLTLRKVK